jgi:para-aminobenzoate synthetase component 1
MGNGECSRLDAHGQSRHALCIALSSRFVRSAPAISRLDWPETPDDLAARWPVDQRLLWLHSGRFHERWARWSIMASPSITWRVTADGRSQWMGDVPAPLQDVRFTHDPLRDLDAIVRATAIDYRRSLSEELPFMGGWIGFISYDVGRVIEPRAAHAARANDSPWPHIELAWCPRSFIFDHATNRWFGTDCEPTSRLTGNAGTNFHLGALSASMEPRKYESIVARTIDYIAAGDVFQANIAQRFSAVFEGSTRGLAISAFAHAQPWNGAYLETCEASRQLVSISPELFLHVDPATRRVTTRPIKGTRPAACDPDELRDSIKDQAELNMIVDLMRNDLGRVCEYATVRVVQPRLIESHPTVHHGVAEITGIAREGTTVGDLLRATFPPGSVTGAPKIRAMQIIDELETPAAGKRGPYCGAIGFISDSGAVSLNVAIRTMMIEGIPVSGHCDRVRSGRATYWAGAGIVADSIPSRELQETLDKTTALQGLMASATCARPRIVAGIRHS